MALTLEQIQAMMPNQGDLLSSLGLTYYGEAEDGSPRYLDSEGSFVSPGMLQENADAGQLSEFQKRELEKQGILNIDSLTSNWNPAEIRKYQKFDYETPEQYLSQLYGGGEKVGNYWVLPENNKDGRMVGTPIRTIESGGNGFFKGFLGNALALGGAAFGLNGISGLIGGAAGGLASGPTLAADALLSGAGPTVAADAAAFGGGSALGGGLELGALGGLGGAGSIGSGLGTSAIDSFFPGAVNMAGPSTVAPSVPNFTDYINSGSIGGSTPTPTPPIPGASSVGNGVGLTEAAQVGGAATGATSAIGRILGGNATDSDWASVLGNLGATGLGLAGANSQSNALNDVYNQQMSLGSPYRDRLNASYQPGFNLATADPAYQGALDTSAQAAARATSAKVGNPVDNPGAYAEMQKYITNSTALPALQNYRSQLGTFGQLGTNTAGAAALGGAQSQGGTYNALGYGLGQLTQPDNPFKGLLSNLGKSNSLFSF
jgi:hypothetical protein